MEAPLAKIKYVALSTHYMEENVPSSQYGQITKIVQVFVHLDPDSILDVGPGFGKYGVLCREYLELSTEDGPYGEFKHRVDAVEVFESYVTAIHRYIYNNIYIGDASTLIASLTHSYGLVLMVDVLEHFERKAGRGMLDAALNAHDVVLVSVPRDIGKQGAVFGNPHETHHTQWSRDELSTIAPGFCIPDATSHIVVLSRKRDLTKLKRLAAPSLPRIVWRVLRDWRP